MVKKLFKLEILVVMLVFGTMVIGCVKSDNKLSNNLDKEINGTWVGYREGYKAEYHFDNGKFELFFIFDGKNFPHHKGTYTTNEGVITLEPTHVPVDYDNEGWITTKEYENNLRAEGYSKEEIAEQMKLYEFVKTNIPYSVSGITLTISINGEPIELTKK